MKERNSICFPMNLKNVDPGILKLIDRMLDEAVSPEEETLFVSSRLKTDILVDAFTFSLLLGPGS